MKRDIFVELMDGLETLADERQHAVEARNRRFGAMEAKPVLPEDFDAPLPDDMLDDFEGTQS